MDEDSEEVSEEETGSCKCCRDCFTSRKGHCKALSWFCVVLCYLLFGGLIFWIAERPNEENEIKLARQRRADAMDYLVSTFVNLSNGSLNGTEAENLVTDLKGYFEDLEELPAESNPLWGYAAAVFFSTTVITTIGYGNIAPTTAAGRTLFIFYALIGIPIAFTFLSIVGHLLSDTLTWFLSPIQKRYDTVWVRITSFVVSCIIGTIIFIFVPALIFWTIESWNYGDSIYYGFVTLTTVGFGDLVPGDTCEMDLIPLYRSCTIIWIWIGLTFVALLIAEMQKLYRQLCTVQNCCNLVTKLRESLQKERTPLLQEQQKGGVLRLGDL